MARAPRIPEDIKQQLRRQWIMDPENSEWKRLDSMPDGTMGVQHYCKCQEWPIIMPLVTLRGRRIYLGRCPICKTIYWRDAVREVN